MTPTCPTHRLPLDGGPVHYWCCTADGVHTVMAADVPTERAAVTR